MKEPVVEFSMFRTSNETLFLSPTPGNQMMDYYRTFVLLKELCDSFCPRLTGLRINDVWRGDPSGEIKQLPSPSQNESGFFLFICFTQSDTATLLNTTKKKKKKRNKQQQNKAWICNVNTEGKHGKR